MDQHLFEICQHFVNCIKVEVLLLSILLSFASITLLEDAKQLQNRDYVPIGNVEHGQLGMFDKPLPCFGCGIGWFSFLLGFFCPLFWYYATILYFGNYYRKDPRERAGLAANAIAALIFTIVVLIVVAIILF